METGERSLRMVRLPGGLEVSEFQAEEIRKAKEYCSLMLDIDKRTLRAFQNPHFAAAWFQLQRLKRLRKTFEGLMWEKGMK